MTSSDDRRPLVVLLGLVCISLIGFGVAMPLLPFFAAEFGAPAWQVALLFSIYSLGQFLGEMTWGPLSDRIGRRPVLLSTILGAAASYIALGFAGNIEVAMAARLLGGFFGGNISVVQSYIADITPPENRAGRMSLVGSAFGVGFIVGPGLGGLLAAPHLGALGFRIPFFTASGLCLAAAAGVLIWLRETRHAGGARSGSLKLPDAISLVRRSPVLTRMIGGVVATSVAFSAMQSTQALWGAARFEWGPQQIGGLAALTGFVSVCSQATLCKRLVRRYGEVRTAMLGIAVSAAAMLLQAFNPWPLAAALLLVSISIGFPLSQPALTSLISRSSSANQQGAVLGIAGGAGALARMAGPVLAGALFSAIGPYTPWLLAAAAMSPALWLVYSGGKRFLSNGS